MSGTFSYAVESQFRIVRISFGGRAMNAKFRSKRLFILCAWANALLLLVIAGCGSGKAPSFPQESEGGAPAEQNIGERIFVDTRWAQYFAVNMTDVNSPLAVGDPVVATTQVQGAPGGTLPGPFAGQSINCRSCHFVVEFQGVANAGNRTYADFTDHSPIPRAMNGFRPQHQEMRSKWSAQMQPHDWTFVSPFRRRVHRSGGFSEDYSDRAAISAGTPRNTNKRWRTLPM